MTLPTTVIQAMTSAHSDALMLACLSLHHSTVDSLRLVNDTKDLVRSAGTFLAAPFAVTLPTDNGETEPTLSVTFPHVGAEVVQFARTIAGHGDTPTADIEIIEISDPNTVLLNYAGYDVLSLPYDRSQVSITLGLTSFLAEPFPQLTFSPGKFPAVF